jgi:membrane protease YdiL (CAAX protease family)
MQEPTAAPTRPPFPGLLQGFLLLVLIWASLVLVAVGAMIVYALGGRDLEQIPTAPLLILSNSVGFLIVLVLGTWMARVSPRRLFPFRRFDPRLLIPLVLVSGAGYLVLGEVDTLLRQIPAPDWFTEFMADVDQATVDMIRRTFWPSAVALMVVAPLTEELFFRGLLLHGFLGRYGRWRAIWASALIFAVAHLTPNQFLPALLTGLFMAWLMAATRNLWLPLLVHFGINGISVIWVGLVLDEGAAAETATRLPVVVTGAALAVLVGGLFWLRRLVGEPSRSL